MGNVAITGALYMHESTVRPDTMHAYSGEKQPRLSYRVTDPTMVALRQSPATPSAPQTPALPFFL